MTSGYSDSATVLWILVTLGPLPPIDAGMTPAERRLAAHMGRGLVPNTDVCRAAWLRRVGVGS
jgi:hypothetical protein